MARIGEIIDEKYEVLREIGRGGMSVVYLAMDKRLNKQWAIKEFRKDKDDANKQAALKGLLEEARLMKKFDHPTLPRIVDIIENQQTVYVVMDYIEGESLNKVLENYGAQSQEAVIEWAKQLSDVLDYLHTQNPPVIYRDMKPANIMLKPDGTVRLIDFGIAREYKEGKQGDTEAIGTRGYAAPEQFGGKGQTDARTDIYSLGVTLYHLVTGKNPAEPPYEIYPIRHWNPSFSSGLEWLIQKCTQLNPNDRYQSCAEVSYVLDNLDKFDSEYKKKQSFRIHLFAAAVVLTVVFSLASAAAFWGSSTLKSNEYIQLVDSGLYASAIEKDPARPEAYEEFLEKLLERALEGELEIVAGDKERELKENSLDTLSEISIGDITALCSRDNLNKVKKENPEAYMRIQFELGYLDYNYGKDGDCVGSFTEALNTKVNGFEKKDEWKYEYLKIIYPLELYSNKISKPKDLNNTNSELALEEDEKAALVEAGFEIVENKPYESYQKAIDAMLRRLGNSSSNDKMTTTFRCRILDRIGSALDGKKTKFKNEVNENDMMSTITLYRDVMNAVISEIENEDEEEKEDYAEWLEKLKEKMGKYEELESTYEELYSKSKSERVN